MQYIERRPQERQRKRRQFLFDFRHNAASSILAMAGGAFTFRSFRCFHEHFCHFSPTPTTGRSGRRVRQAAPPNTAQWPRRAAVVTARNSVGRYAGWLDEKASVKISSKMMPQPQKKLASFIFAGIERLR